MTRELVYFEDFAPGRTWEWGEYTVTKEEIISFASMYDPQPFHLDEDAALAQLAMTDIAFPNPVRAGDRLRISVHCLSLRESKSKPDRGVVVEQCMLLNQRGEECFRCTHTILVPKRTT